ncbi:MAG: hypothetical protein KGJ62_01840 [Armatimonadetes bacterium]|nr:hypothetical protein [Armatimonadota bacterium]MDE2205520.1 hypothetical protein [Armatimonadota bacterium]
MVILSVVAGTVLILAVAIGGALRLYRLYKGALKDLLEASRLVNQSDISVTNQAKFAVSKAETLLAIVNASLDTACKQFYASLTTHTYSTVDAPAVQTPVAAIAALPTNAGSGHMAQSDALLKVQLETAHSDVATAYEEYERLVRVEVEAIGNYNMLRQQLPTKWVAELQPTRFPKDRPCPQRDALVINIPPPPDDVGIVSGPLAGADSHNLRIVGRGDL